MGHSPRLWFIADNVPEAAANEVEAEVDVMTEVLPGGGDDGAPAASDEGAVDRQAWLESRLDVPHVLGWFVLSEGGSVKYSDQPYDPDVHAHFYLLLQQMIASAQLVGMSNWSELVVKGAEGTILMAADTQSVMANADYVVVFLDAEGEVSQVLARFAQAG